MFIKITTKLNDLVTVPDCAIAVHHPFIINVTLFTIGFLKDI